MKKIRVFTILLFIFSLSLAGCTPANTNNEQLTNELKEKDLKIAELEERLNTKDEGISRLNQQIRDLSGGVLSQALDVMDIIKNGDMVLLADYIHPSKGVRFTPYPYIDIQHNLVFTAQEVSNLMDDDEIKNWGEYDGSGEPIDLTFSDYYDKFIYDKDFINAHIIGNNTAIGQGNTVNNMTDAYPDGHFTEFHFTGFDAQYEGIDWESLTLVFEESDGIYYLVGVVHGQWTI